MAYKALQQLDSLKTEADAVLVLVRGPDAPPLQQWAINSSKWKAILSETGSCVRVLAHDTDIELRDTFAWPELLAEAYRLLEGLLESIPDQDSAYPISFLCHGLGGYVLKQALCIANAQPQRYTSLLTSIGGIIFLGVPHSLADPEKLIARSILMLRSAPFPLSKQSITRLENDSEWLLEVHRLFDDIKLRTSVLAVYETQATKFKGRFMEGKGLSPLMKVKLVDKELATTRSPDEELVGLEGQHADICRLWRPESEATKTIERWLPFVFGPECRDKIQRRLDLLREPSSPDKSISSISSYDAARKGETFQPSVESKIDGSSDFADRSSSTLKWEIQPLLEDMKISRRFAKLPCYMTDAIVPNKEFIGRTDILAELDRCLLPSKPSFSSEPQKQKHVALWGLGGLGKTTIAIEFAFSRKDYFDAIFWLPADKIEKLDQAFSKIASKLGLEDESEPSSAVISRGLAKGWLEDPKRNLGQMEGVLGQTDANWLLIFDNADSPDILQDYWPISSNGSILVTSRDPRAKLTPSLATNNIALDILKEDEAAEMLRELSHVHKQDDTSIEIARRLGCLPLAIAQMAAVIQHQYLSFGEFLEKYNNQAYRKKLQKYQPGKSLQGARGNMSSIWSIEQLTPPSRTLIEICALLDPDCIQDRTFKIEESQLSYLEDYPDEFDYTEARTELIRTSLIQWNAELREFRIHRILQDSLLSEMSEDRFPKIFRASVQLVCNAWGPIDLTKRHNIELSRMRVSVFPHALSLKAVYEQYRLEDAQESSLLLGGLMVEAGWYQHERGNISDIRGLFHLALKIAQDFPGDEATRIQCDAYYGLAAVANETNDAQGCLKNTKQLLEIRQKLCQEGSPEDLRLAIAHNEYAIALVMMKSYDAAVLNFQRSIGVFQKLEGYWPGMDTNPRTNLGFTFLAMNRLDEAFEILRKLLEDREARFGVMDTESFRTGRVLKGLANVTLVQRRLDQSEEFDKRALAQWQSTIGSNHHKTADGCIGVAKHCIRHSDFDSARKLLDQALKVYRLRAEIFKPQIARTLFLKARVAMLSNAEAEATTLFREARDLRSSIPGTAVIGDAELCDADFEELIILWSR